MSDDKAIEAIARYCIAIGVDAEGIRYLWSQIAITIDEIKQNERWMK